MRNGIEKPKIQRCSKCRKNKKIVATGESYKTMQGLKNGLKAIKNAFKVTKVTDLTK